MATEDDSPSQLRPARLFEALQRHGVRYVAVDSYPAILQGVDLPMTDLDIVPATDRENLERVIGCLAELEAKERSGEAIEELRADPESLTDRSFRMFATKFGELDIVFRPAGFPGGYADLIDNVVVATIEDESDHSLVVEAQLADVRDVYESKRQSRRPKDVLVLPRFRGIHPDDPRALARARYLTGLARRKESEDDEPD